VNRVQLCFGILCDRQLQLWQRKCLEKLQSLSGVVPAVLLVCHASAEERAAAEPQGLFRYLGKLEPGSPAGPAELPESVARLPAIDVQVQPGEPGNPAAGLQLTAPCIAAIRAHQLHFILSFSAAPVHALNGLAAYGVWKFEFGDWEHFRGSPTGFWEVYRNAPTSGAMLARSTSDPDVVIPLRRGNLRTRQFSYRQNRDQLLTRFTHWPAQVCRDLLNGHPQVLQAEPVRGSEAINTAPCNKGVIRFVCRMMCYIVSRGMRSWFEHDHWNIGIIEQPIEDFINPQRERKPVKWLSKPGPGEFVADPFGVMREGQLTIFCEYLDYRDGVGTIAAIQPSGSAARVPVAIGPFPPVHLSYPAVFEHEGRILCIPETQGAREVALYGLERFPDKWIKVAALIANAAVVDATLFQHGDLWWLAGASDPGGAQSGADLYLWHALDITGPWTAHPANPVKTDVCSARPAGTPFMSDGVLYRPAQDSSVTYGSRVVIHRVHTLTTTTFREEPVAFVEPDVKGPYPDGLHTLSAVGGMTLIDGKRLKFAPAEFRRVMRRMLMRRLRKLAYSVYPKPRVSNNERHNSA
jgi:hypothetical protein